MSTVSELQIAQVGYEAGKMAIEKTKPEILKVNILYEQESTKNPREKNIINPGHIGYIPAEDIITIAGPRRGMNCMGIIEFSPEAIPALIKALKELTE